MDFSDQIELGARLASLTSPTSARSSATKFRVVLLDEYQDTSVAQAIMLSRIFSGPDPAGGRGHAVTAVGDPNQAIYGWRGASVSNILDFAETFPAATGTVPTYPLTVNRRSERRILEAANLLAAPLYDAHDAVAPLEPKPEAGDGVVATAVHETHARRARGRWSQACAPRTRTTGACRGPRSASSPATTRTPPRSSTRSPTRASRSRSSASTACCGCPRSPRSSRSCT